MRILTLVTAALFTCACLDTGELEKSFPYDRFDLVVEVNDENIYFRSVIDEPCGCNEYPLEIGQCAESVDACGENCIKCIDWISLDGETYTQEGDSKYFDFTGWKEHGKSPGDTIEVTVMGCSLQHTLQVTVPQPRSISATIPHFDGEDLNYTWSPLDADAIEVFASHGLGSTACWTEDTGEYQLPWFETGYLRTAVSSLHTQKKYTYEKLHVQVHEVSTVTFNHY